MGAWETHYKNESFPDKMEKLEQRSRRLVSKNALPDTYVATQSTRRRR